MSAADLARKMSSDSKAIPSTKRMLITDACQMPHDYSSTPGGTLYSTTPGGSRIVYDRSFLINLRNSPISRTPPHSHNIPAMLLKGSPTNAAPSPVNGRMPTLADDHHEQFHMEM